MHNQSLYLDFFSFVPMVFLARVRKTHFQSTLIFIFFVQNLVIVLASIFLNTRMQYEDSRKTPAFWM